MGRGFGFAFVVALALSLASCSDPLRPYPVVGKVLYQGKPAEGAMVTFVPIDAALKVRPAGVVQANGDFRLSTRGTFDGAPVGKYSVTIIYPSAEKKIDEQNAGPDVFKGKYATPDSSPLRADIEARDNELPPYSLK
jgi:hypothetical protein